MKRTTVLLPDETAELLRLESERRGITPSELVREAITTHVVPKPGEVKGFLKLAAAFNGPPPHDTAEQADELLSDLAGYAAKESGLGDRDR